MYTINLLKKLTSSEITRTIGIETYVDYIKNGLDLENLQIARSFGKGTEEYKKYKSERVNVVFNFLFNKTRNNDSIIKSTGLLYFDIDGDFDITSINTNNLFIFHKSFGGSGWCILVKVDNIPHTSFNSFKSAYYCVADQLGITHVMDTNAIKMTQPNVISYDPNIVVNNDSPVFDCFDYNSDEIIEEKIEISKNLILKSQLESYSEDCVYIPEGREFVECRSSYDKNGKITKIKDGDKNRFLSTFANNLIYLNPNANTTQLFCFMKYIYQSHCVGNVDIKYLKDLIENKIKLKNSGRLKPISAKLKYKWINPMIANKLEAFHAKRKSLTDDRLTSYFESEIIEETEKITIDLISLKTGISEKTIRTRFKENPEYKQIVKSINDKKKNKSVKEVKIVEVLKPLVSENIVEECFDWNVTDDEDITVFSLENISHVKEIIAEEETIEEDLDIEDDVTVLGFQSILPIEEKLTSEILSVDQNEVDWKIVNELNVAMDMFMTRQMIQSKFEEAYVNLDLDLQFKFEDLKKYYAYTYSPKKDINSDKPLIMLNRVILRP